MGLFDFLKRKKKADEAAGGTIDLGADALPGVDPTETRFTQEYREFLEEQEKAESEKVPPCVPEDGGTDEGSEA